MAELTTIARPYAVAAFGLAREANALSAWSGMLRDTCAIVADPQLATALRNPRLTAGDKEALLLSVLGERVDALFGNLLRVLVRANRIALLPDVARLFDQLKGEADGVAQAKITSAMPLSEQELAEMVGALEKHFRLRIEATVEVDASLLGGARIAVGDTVIDGTVQAQLAAMSRHLRA